MLILDHTDLAKHLDCEPTEGGIGSVLYRNTECGIIFSLVPGGVSVAGYCEGVDETCDPRTLAYPFDSADFDKLVGDADKDGITLWNQTHGCPECFDADRDPYDDGPALVDPNCAFCGGEGVIL
jgi:hypothetical protein